MDAQTPKNMRPMSEDTAAPAFVFRIAAQTGQNKNIEVTFGVPSDMTPRDMNAYVDKVSSILDRQNEKGILEALKALLESTKKNVITQREQRANFESKCRMDHVIGNRRGDWKANESQRAQLGNFDATIRDLLENRIPQIEKQMAESERKINEAS